MSTTLRAVQGTVDDQQGQTIGSGSVNLAVASGIPVNITGNATYNVNGTGALAFYGPAESNLGVSGNWINYSANVAGTVSITVTAPTGALVLNGQSLPAGTYTINGSSVALAGSGPSVAPNFSGSASITTTGGAANLASGRGGITLDGSSLDISNGATLAYYTGGIIVAAGGNDLDDVTFDGSATNVLTVSATPNTLTTDQNTPVTIQPDVNTTVAGTFNVAAQAPPGWNVTVNNQGGVVATPAPGLQNGTHPIQIVDRSTSNPGLVAQCTVHVTLTPTTPGFSLTVNPDTRYTVPFDGAQVPSAFGASIRNTGPASDTYNLTFAKVPGGFSLLNSGSQITILAGRTGIVGIYLQPTAAELPPPGTTVSFTVTATSTTNPNDSQTVNVSFTVPAIEAATVTSTPAQVATTPGTVTTATLSIINLGNVPYNAALSTTTLDVSSNALLGNVQTDGTGESVAVNPGAPGLDYIAGNQDISIVDVSNPGSPKVLSTFGGGDVNQGGLNLAAALATTPVTVTVTVPTNGVSVVPTSFSITPTSTTTGANSETLTWSLNLAPGESRQITWQSTVSDLQPNQIQQVAAGATVQFIVGGSNQTITLPAVSVAGVEMPETAVIAVQVAVPGAAAIADASTAAIALGMTDLAARLGDLSTALTNLVQTPASATYKNQALAALASILSLMANDPNLEEFVAPLTAARDQLAAANHDRPADARHDWVCRRAIHDRGDRGGLKRST